MISPVSGPSSRYPIKRQGALRGIKKSASRDNPIKNNYETIKSEYGFSKRGVLPFENPKSPISQQLPQLQEKDKRPPLNYNSLPQEQLHVSFVKGDIHHQTYPSQQPPHDGLIIIIPESKPQSYTNRVSPENTKNHASKLWSGSPDSSLQLGEKRPLRNDIDQAYVSKSALQTPMQHSPANKNYISPLQIEHLQKLKAAYRH